jgi:hypothetical protein
VKIIDENLRPKTLIFLGKKKEGENLEKILEEEYRTDKEKMNHILSRNLINEGEVGISKKPRHEDLDPNLRVMGYIYAKQKHSLNRNSILRPANNLINFDNLFSLCKRFFTQNSHKDRSHVETLSFLDELLSGEDLSGNKAIIVVPSVYYPGNLFIDNARQFLVDAV